PNATPSSSAASRALAITAWCPTCTPSKLPSAIAAPRASLGIVEVGPKLGIRSQSLSQRRRNCAYPFPISNHGAHEPARVHSYLSAVLPKILVSLLSVIL